MGASCFGVLPEPGATGRFNAARTIQAPIIRLLRLFSACQGISSALRPRSSPVERAHPDPPNPCARASGLHVRLLGTLSLLGACLSSGARLCWPLLVRQYAVPRSNRLLSVSVWCCPPLRSSPPPPARPPWRVHVGVIWRASRRRLLLPPLLLRLLLLVRVPLLSFGRRGSPAGRPRAFVRRCIALLPLQIRLPLGGSALKGGTRPATPPADAPDDTACTLHAGLPATDRRPRRRLNPCPAHRP